MRPIDSRLAHHFSRLVLLLRISTADSACRSRSTATAATDRRMRQADGRAVRATRALPPGLLPAFQLYQILISAIIINYHQQAYVLPARALLLGHGARIDAGACRPSVSQSANLTIKWTMDRERACHFD